MTAPAFITPTPISSPTATSSHLHLCRSHQPVPHVVRIHPSASLPNNMSTSSPPARPPSSPSRTLICTSLIATTVAAMLEQSKAAARAGTDLVELRLDHLSADELPNWHVLLPQLPVPAIVTNRPTWEGGQSTADEPTRLSILLDAVHRGVSHVDVELAAIDRFRELSTSVGLSSPFPSTKLILSHHDFSKPLTSDALNVVLERMRSCGADICKVAMLATSALDNVTVIDALASSPVPTVCLAMGEQGLLSRIAAGRFGAYLTFAALDAESAAAPGQVGLDAMVGLYGASAIGKETPLYGVIGNPVSHSMSPALHNAALRAKGLEGAYVPLRVDGEYATFVRAMAKRGFVGFSVTIPAKLEVLKAMDELDDVTGQIGAMNTVVRREDGSLKGYNTDWVAAISAVEEQFENGLNGRNVVCIGAGGAGRALAFGALARGADGVIVVNRSRGRAEQLAAELGEKATAMSLEEFNEERDIVYDALLNSTSVGMHPHEEDTPVVREQLIEGAVVFDAVYNPLETRLLRDAKERGCVTVSGLEMFVRQAAEQFRLWFPGVEAPVDVMREVVLKKLGH